MDTWNTETTMQHERVPAWLVEFAQLWTSQSATNPHYREEYQQIKRLASAANVPPFLITLRLFRDTYQVQPTTTWDQFHARIDTQIAASGDQLQLHLNVLPTEEVQRAAAAKALQDTAARAVTTMEEAIQTDDNATFQEAAAHCGQAQEQWLIVAQQMTPEQARTLMVDFAQHELTRWMQARLPGPPPLIFDRFPPSPPASLTAAGCTLQAAIQWTLIHGIAHLTNTRSRGHVPCRVPHLPPGTLLVTSLLHIVFPAVTK
ncbi:hypothetical protein KDH_28300 [Dictyobacter sp. S3.2.2.5]|uniref:Uncharacterized protein n=1 Tax=Dictyobacter halimunensis TaxID=3026934 RepID=A0ABQ6FT47_9CHLR|nr:hypothetical protein KDH_28300 [Dictyobacter sp. S3.2.2.5]